jgi:hypothetical protein
LADHTVVLYEESDDRLAEKRDVWVPLNELLAQAVIAH